MYFRTDRSRVKDLSELSSTLSHTEVMFSKRQGANICNCSCIYIYVATPSQEESKLNPCYITQKTTEGDKEGAKRRRREDNEQEARAKLRRRQGTNSSGTKKSKENTRERGKETANGRY